MRTLLLTMLLGLSLQMLAQDATTTDSGSINDDTATLYFYRKPEFYNGRFEIWVNGVRIVSNFRSSTYFWLNLEAGTYEIRTKGRPSWAIYENKYQLQIEAGQKYYIEAVLNYGFLETSLRLEERNQADFQQLNDKLRFNANARRQLD